MQDWYIYGAGGLGGETADILADAMQAGMAAQHRICFVEDMPKDSEVGGVPLVALADCTAGAPVTIAVGEPAARVVMLNKARAAGLVPSSIISPRAFVSPKAVLGEGVIVAPLASIQARAMLGDNVAVNTQAIVGHDVSVAAHSVISSQVNLGGAVKVGTESYIGMGALVKEGLTVGNSSIIGMGSVVYRDIPDDVIALGNPARPARRNEDKKIFR